MRTKLKNWGAVFNGANWVLQKGTPTVDAKLKQLEEKTKAELAKLQHANGEHRWVSAYH